MSAPELNSSRPPLPASGFPALWYHEPLNLPFERSKPPFTRAAGSRHDDLDPSCEVGVNGPQAWAVLSLSLAGFALAGCDPRAGAARPREHRSVEPRLSDVPL
jgi:hypothetical protein